MQKTISDNDYQFLDKLTFDNSMLINSIEDDNVRAEVISAIQEIPFLYNLTKRNRKKLSDYKRWDNPYDYDDRVEDPNGRIEVDVTEPHELVDMDYFRERALYFQKHGTYTDITPNRYPGSRYMRFWREEQRRCRDGYVRESDGEWITGYHYWYLNYSPIQITEDAKEHKKFIKSKNPDELASKASKKRKAERKRNFPRVWDSDYLWFHYVEKAEQNGHHVVNLKSRGKGYEQPYTSVIKTLNGDITMGDVKVGDMVLTPAGIETRVIEKVEQGVKDVYEVTFSDGRKVECGKDHLWAVYKNYSPSRPKPYQVLSTEEMMNDGLYYDTKQKQKVYKYRLPEIHPIDYLQEKELPIHPYILGALLGDGSMSTSNIRIASDDQEILDHFQNILGEDYAIIYDPTTTNNHRITYKPARRMYKKVNPLKKAIIDNGLNVTCKNKYIPDVYKRSSVVDRILLVKGLMDTDGCANKDGGIEFTNTSEQLVDDLADILRSLAIPCRKGFSQREGESHIRTEKTGLRKIKRGNIFRLYIKTNKKVFTLERKNSRLRDDMHRFTKPFIKEIKKVRRDRCACIVLNNDENVYLTDGYIPTHNSFKGSSKLTRNYYHFKGSNSIAIASESSYLLGDGLLNKAWDILNFIDNNTPWRKSRDYADTKEHKKASYRDPKTKTERGILSEIMGVSTNGQPERARGKRAKLVLFEESGKFPHFKTTLGIARPSVEQGRSVFGTIVAWGTGGTASSDFDGIKEAFYSPSTFNMMGLPNVYDRKVAVGNECGFYCGDYMNREGCYDDNGNSDVTTALIEIFEDREIVKKSSTDPNALIQEKADRSITPQEACMRKEGHLFNVEDLKIHAAEVDTNPKKYTDATWKVKMYFQDGEVKWKLSDRDPVRQFPIVENKGLEGCVEIFEHPIASGGGIPANIYFAGIDPYDDDNASGPSLGSIQIGNILTRRIVAEYTGRPQTAEEFYEICYRLMRYYNARGNYENNKKGMFQYFDRINATYMLCDTPSILKDMEITRKVGFGNTAKGTNATKAVNNWGNSLIRSYLMEQAYSKEEGTRNYTTIVSPGMLKELIAYDPEIGNYDRIAALRMLLIMFADREKFGISDPDAIEEGDGRKLIDDFFLRNRPSMGVRFRSNERESRSDKRLIRRKR